MPAPSIPHPQQARLSGLPEAELLLLQAASGNADLAQSSLAAWKAARRFRRYDEIDFPATLLLPRVYRRMVQAGQSDPWFPQLTRLTRYHWLNNLEELRHFLPALKQLPAAGVTPLLAGGWALVAGGYVDDIQDHPQLGPELLIRPEEGTPTRQTLQALDWYCPRLPPVAGWHNEDWQNADGGRLRIRYQWLPRRYPVVGYQSLVAQAEPSDLNGCEVLVPSATDQLEQLCVQACQDRPAAGNRCVYLVDVLRLLERAANQVDWERLLRQSSARTTLSAVQQALVFLRAGFSAPVPLEWLEHRELREPATPSWLARHSPWLRYLRAEQAAGRNPCGLSAFRYALWSVARR